MIQALKRLWKMRGLMSKADPLHSCPVYKEHGCSHVDGLLCHVDTCSIVKAYNDHALTVSLYPTVSRHNKHDFMALKPSVAAHTDPECIANALRIGRLINIGYTPDKKMSLEGARLTGVIKLNKLFGYINMSIGEFDFTSILFEYDLGGKVLFEKSGRVSLIDKKYLRNSIKLAITQDDINILSDNCAELKPFTIELTANFMLDIDNKRIAMVIDEEKVVSDDLVFTNYEWTISFRGFSIESEYIFVPSLSDLNPPKKR